ncbi:MAG: rhomboid family intramembrane serine protease [Actinomycetota bacterium]
MLPLKDLNPTSRTAWVTIGLIAANVVVFLLWQPTFAHSDLKQELFFFCHAEIPWETTHQTSLAEGGRAAVQAIDRENIGVNGRALQLVLQGHAERVRGVPRDAESCPHKSWWQSIFVAMFLHGGWLHIAGNMLYLWIFGNNVEDKIGPAFYLLFYLIGGIAAAAAQTATSTGSVIPSLGASGAIAAVLGAYLVMFPRRRVLVLLFFFLITMIEVPAIVVLGLWFLLQAFSGTTALTQHVTGGVAYWAHIGGFVTGMIAALLFFPKERRQPPHPEFTW